MAKCAGCDAGMTIWYDHCKQPAAGPGYVNVSVLMGVAEAAAASGYISPLSNLARARVYLERGTLDNTYMYGSVNKTYDFFAGYVADPSSQLQFVQSIPHAHAQLTADPWLSNASCGQGKPWAPPALQNCGYDAAGAALQHFYQGSLVTPQSLAFANPQYLTQFDQTLYFPTIWPGLSSIGYVYIPPACEPGGSAPSCKLHVALHGCGMSIWNSNMNTSFVEHTGFNAWADANNMVVLYPQSGGFEEQGRPAPTPQLQGGCWDGYGQTGWDYVYQTGPQMITVRAMIKALAGI